MNKAEKLVKRIAEENKNLNRGEIMHQVYDAVQKKIGKTEDGFYHYPPEYDKALRELEYKLGF